MGVWCDLHDRPLWLPLAVSGLMRVRGDEADLGASQDKMNRNACDIGALEAL